MNYKDELKLAEMILNHVTTDFEDSFNQNKITIEKSKKAGTAPFYTSLTDEQKNLYYLVSKRITIDAVSITIGALSGVDFDDLEIRYKGEKLENIQETFLEAYLKKECDEGRNPNMPAF